MGEYIAKARFALDVRPTFVSGVGLHSLCSFGQDGSELLATAEQYDGCLGIAPSRVTQNLIDGAMKGLPAIPKLAFSDENILALIPDEDVSLSTIVERFTRRLPLILTIELYEVMDPNTLFVHLRESPWASLHDQRHVFDDTENLLVVLLF
jgi:hypothetical protein